MKKSLLFIENNVADYQQLIDATEPNNTEVHILDTASDGLSQIAQILAGRTDIDALHIISHGSSGSLSLGTATLNSQNINAYQPLLAQIGASLSDNADILLYGCDVAAGDVGQSFIEQLAVMTGADVAASNDLTGNAGLGGDWKLEVATGNIEAASLNVPNYNNLLVTPTDLVSTTGSLQFALASNFNSGYSTAVALGDVNGDGKLDIITTNFNDDKISVLIGNSAGGFNIAKNFTVGDAPISVALGDVNGDGKLDIVTANSGSNDVTVMLGNGIGGFSVPITKPSWGEVAPTDNPSTSSLTTTSNLSVGTQPYSVALGDVNGDGKLDIVTANQIGGNVSVLIGNGTGFFNTASDFSTGNGYPNSVALGDVNGDGKLDIVTANVFSNNIAVLTGNGVGGFNAANNFALDASVATNSTSSVSLGDINGDGKLDIVTSNRWSNDVSVLIGNGTGSFDTTSNFAVGIHPQKVVLGDVNGDGNLDIVTANMDNHNVSVLTNNGTGGFNVASNFAVGSYPFSITLGDVNSDGRLDIVTANNGSGDVSVLINTPQPTSEYIFNSIGYYRFFAMLSSAVYLHTGVGDEAPPTEHNAFDLDNYQKIVASGFHFLSASELGIAASGNDTAAWFDNVQPLNPISPLISQSRAYDYDFKDGFYGTDAQFSPASSFASVGTTKDALFVTFRGTDQLWDWVTDVTGMHQQYAMYDALTRAIDAYLANKPQDFKVYVSGHSLGGQMATLYMSEHFGDTRFTAVEFAAASKLLTDNHGNLLAFDNPNIVNVEMPWDPVPNLGFNRGDVIQIKFNGTLSVPLVNHPITETFKYIDEIDKVARNPSSDITLHLNKLADNNAVNLMIEAQKAVDIPSVSLIGNNTVIINGSDGETYRAFENLTLNNPIVKNIIIADDSFSPSENVNYFAKSTDTNGKVIVGNAGKNMLVGGAGNDVLIGGADEDLLLGGKGDDILIGNKYDAVSLSFDKTKLPLEVRNYIDTYADAFAPDNQDVSYLMGGLGKDEMYGSRLDNDYFLIDVNLANNANNVDSIKDFYMANLLSDPSAEDYLVFSGEQLGIDIYTIDSNPLDYPDVLGSNNAAYLSSFNFQVEQSISSVSYFLDPNPHEANFILSKDNNGLYFDKDGIDTAYSPTLLAYINPASYGWSSNLSTFDADQILLVSSFKDMQFLSVSIDSITAVTQQGITGSNSNDTLIGTTGNDTFNGLAGADRMIGGRGDDTYYVDNVRDVVRENAGQGLDTVYSSISYGLAANVENLVLTGTEAINGVGNGLANHLTGNMANNVLSGGAGADIIDGQGGADIMRGGLGNDSYTVDNIGDVVIESYARNAKDMVYSTVSYALSNYVYGLTLDANSGDINATGNASNNKLVGNAGNNILDGKAGADTMIGGAGADSYYVNSVGDVVTENAGEGFDTVYTSVNSSKPLAANVEALVLTGAVTVGYGNNLDNQLIGNALNNTLDGGMGVDTMIGGAGNDTYIVDNVADIVTENAGEGFDTVYSSILYVLPDNVEALVLLGTAAINMIGNANDNILTGNTSNNILTGGEGADTLMGGRGQDSYNLAETIAATDTLQIAKGDSLIISPDMASNFSLGTGAGTAGVDKLDLPSHIIAANTVAKDGVDRGIIHSHHIDNGIISFDDIDNYTAPLTITANNIYEVFSYLQTNIVGKSTIAFVSEGNTFIFQDSGADTNGNLVELVGVSATSLSPTGLAAGSVWIM